MPIRRRHAKAMSGKDSQLQIRVSAAEKAAIRRAADRARLDVSSWVLSRLLPPARSRFRELTDELAREPSQRRFTLAALNDLLTEIPPDAFREAVAEPPTDRLDPWAANYVAAMVETAAHRHLVPPPDWTRAVQPLTRPAFGSPLESLRLHLLLAAPPAFKRRNIFVDSSIGDRV
jgi:uncharacterized protein (DUF1778 family)